MEIITNTILYFSGTGNSLQVAKDINSEIKGFDLCKITSLANEEKIIVKSRVLGIVFPVYYARVPLIVEKILKKLIVDKNTYIFAVATFAGGVSDVLIKLKNTLQKKHIILNAGFLVHMPGNNIFTHGAFPTKIQEIIFKKEKAKIKKISTVIKNRTDFKCEISKLRIDILIDKASSKATDKIIKDLHNTDKEFWVNGKCNGCRICEKTCSVNNIEFTDDKLIWKNKCEKCAACIQLCPMESIQWGEHTLNRKRYNNPNVNIKELMI